MIHFIELEFGRNIFVCVNKIEQVAYKIKDGDFHFYFDFVSGRSVTYVVGEDTANHIKENLHV